MPSYKKHALFSIVMALPFFPNVFYLALALVGASIIDMDHRVKKKNLLFMAFFGLILTLILYILKLPFLIGVILVALALLFYISKHRGFMHSIIGISLVTCFLGMFVLGSNILLQDFKIDLKLSLVLISLVMGFLILNKRLLPLYSLLVTVGIILTPSMIVNPYYIFGALFVGCLSHVVLDLFTPSGVELLNPLSSKRCRKSCGLIFFGAWILLVFVSFFYPIS